MNLDRPDHVPADQLEWFLGPKNLTLGSSEGSKTLVIEPKDEALKVLAAILNAGTGQDLDAVRRLNEAALAIHEWKPTGRHEYRTDENNVVLDVEPTYLCPHCLHTGFKDNPCDTRKALTGAS